MEKHTPKQLFSKVKRTAEEDKKDTNTNHRPDDKDDLMQ